MLKEKKISIVIPNYNGEKTLDKCLGALQNLQYKNFDVLVVDDCSTDHSDVIIEKYPYEWIRLPSNHGPATVRNVGARHSEGEILLFVDSDITLKKGDLKKVNESFIGEKVAVVSGMPDKFCKFKNLCSQYFNLRIFYNFVNSKHTHYFGGCFAVRKKAFDEVGGFNENFKTASVEEDDLAFRVLRKGYFTSLNKDLQVNHLKYLSFWRLMKNDFNRASDRMKMVLRERGKNHGVKKLSATTNQKTLAFVVPLMALFFILSYLFPMFIIMFAGAYSIFFLSSMKFADFFEKVTQKYYVRVFILLFMDMIIVDFGLLYGLISYIGGDKY